MEGEEGTFIDYRVVKAREWLLGEDLVSFPRDMGGKRLIILRACVNPSLEVRDEFALWESENESGNIRGRPDGLCLVTNAKHEDLHYFN